MPEASTLPGDAPHGIVLLRSGRMMEGQITRDGDDYVVYVAGDGIRVLSNDVRFACRSLGEAYEIQRQRIDPENADQHIELARWCLSQGLTSQAAQELQQAADVAPNRSDVKNMLEFLSGGQTSAGAATAVPARPGTSEQPMHRGPRPRVGPAVQKQFVTSVQPVLLKTCATAGCHDSNSPTHLALTHPQDDRRSDRVNLEENLRLVLQFVDRTNPEASRLLLIPRKPHGSEEGPVFADPNDPEYQRIVAWVYELSGKPSPLYAGIALQAEPTRRVVRPPVVVPFGSSAFNPLGAALDPAAAVLAGSGSTIPPAATIATSGQSTQAQPGVQNQTNPQQFPPHGNAAVQNSLTLSAPQAGAGFGSIPPGPGFDGLGANPFVPSQQTTVPGVEIPPANGVAGFGVPAAGTLPPSGPTFDAAAASGPQIPPGNMNGFGFQPPVVPQGGVLQNQQIPSAQAPSTLPNPLGPKRLGKGLQGLFGIGRNKEQ